VAEAATIHVDAFQQHNDQSWKQPTRPKVKPSINSSLDAGPPRAKKPPAARLDHVAAGGGGGRIEITLLNAFALGTARIPPTSP